MKASLLQQGHPYFVEHRETRVITTVFEGAPSQVARHGVIKKVIVINCNLITFSKIIECNCNKTFS